MLATLQPYITAAMVMFILLAAAMLPHEFRRCHREGRSFLTGRPRI